MIPQIYFSAADRQMEAFLGKARFQESLVMNLLFRGDYLAPDIFFFISRYIEDEILKTYEKSLIEECVYRGAIIPAFRDRSCSSFQEALKSVREAPGGVIQGIRHKADDVAKRLDNALKRLGSSCKIGYWPEFEVGEKFKEVVKKLLSVDKPPVGARTSRMLHLWGHAEKLRKSCVEEAIYATYKKVGRGLRRGELFNAVGRALQHPESEIHDVRQLLRITQTEVEKEALRAFIMWVNECYHYNQSNAFGVRPHLPACDLSTAVIPFATLPEAYPEDSGYPVFLREELHLEVESPTPKFLLTLPASELLDIRSEYGVDYFRAVHAWINHGQESNADKVREIAQVYASDITRSCQKHLRELPPTTLSIWLYRSSLPRPASILLGRAVQAAKAIPVANIGVEVVEGGLDILAWHRSKPHRFLVVHKRPPKPRSEPSLDLNLPCHY